MKDFSVAMALVDYIPVIFFAIAAVILMRDMYNKMSKGAFALFAAGTIDIICAGGLKATYKLLYATGVCDFQALDHLFFPLQSIGFLLAGVGMVAVLCHKQSKDMAYAVVPVYFSGTVVFVALMVAGLGCMNTGLSIISVKMKKKGIVVLFVISFICSLCMGYLSSKDFAQAAMNWIAEGINVVGQGSLLAGTILLHKAGLTQYEIRKGEKVC